MFRPSISRFLDPHTRASLEAELARGSRNPKLQPLLRRESPDLWPRFARYYDHLAHLPRRVRRGLQRQWKRSLSGVALLLALGQAPALAATIPVDGTTCTLVDAITAANSDTTIGGCPAGAPRLDTLILDPNSTHTLTAVNNTIRGATGLPVVTSHIVIEGHGSTITRDASAEFRIFLVDVGGDLTLKETTVSGGVAPIVHVEQTCQDYYGNPFDCSYDGRAQGGGLAVYAGTLTLTKTTVSGNSAIQNGGGVYTGFVEDDGTALYGTVTLSDTTISGNGATRVGGGVSTRGSLFTAKNSTITGNSAQFGGGGVFLSVNTATINHSTISGNVTTNGGGAGIDNRGSTATLALNDSTVADNYAMGVGFASGSGIFNQGSLTVTNSTISGNKTSLDSGANGGGIYNAYASNFTLTNSTVSGNSASGHGGGVYLSGISATITHSTITDNTAYYGGGLSNSVPGAHLIHTLVSGNIAPRGAEVLDFVNNIAADNFNLFGHADVTDTDAFVGFVPGANDNTATSDGTTPTALAAILDTTLASNGGPTKTHALVAGSPAVDGVARRCPPPRTDQRGFRRPVDGDGDHVPKCDIGAFERAAQVTP